MPEADATGFIARGWALPIGPGDPVAEEPASYEAATPEPVTEKRKPKKKGKFFGADD